MLKEVGNTLYVDESEFKKLSGEALVSFMKEHADNAPRMKFIDSFKDLSSRSALKAAIETMDSSIPLRIVFCNLDTKYTYDTHQAIALKQSLLDLLEATRPAYPFAKRPESFKLNKTFVLGQNEIVHNSYSMKVTTFEKRWELLRNYWKEENSHHLTVFSGSRRVEVHGDQVFVGCQRFQRYEVEALAELYNLEF
jgi:hypothetical protein